MPKRVSRSKRMLQNIVRRHQARVENSPKTNGAAEKQQLSIGELMEYSEAYYAQLMLARMEKK